MQTEHDTLDIVELGTASVITQGSNKGHNEMGGLTQSAGLSDDD